MNLSHMTYLSVDTTWYPIRTGGSIIAAYSSHETKEVVNMLARHYHVVVHGACTGRCSNTEYASHWRNNHRLRVSRLSGCFRAKNKKSRYYTVAPINVVIDSIEV